MAIGIDGNGSITGLSVGGLPDATIVDADIATLSSSKLTGALPAVDGSALTGVAPTKADIDALGIAASSITGALPVIDGSNLTGVSGGKVLQVVNAIDTGSPTSSSTTYVDTGLTASITPSSTSSKVLVIVSLDGTVQGGDTSINYRCYRDSTEIGGTIIGRKIGDSNNSDGTPAAFSFTVLDTPSSTSSLTYKTQFSNANATNIARMNNGYGSSTITLMEIGT